MSEKDSTIHSLRKEVEKTKKIAKEKISKTKKETEATITEKNAIIHSLKKQKEEAEATIHSLIKQKAEAEATIHSLSAEKDGTIHSLIKQKTEAEATFHSLSAELTEKDGTIHSLEKIITEKDAILKQETFVFRSTGGRQGWDLIWKSSLNILIINIENKFSWFPLSAFLLGARLIQYQYMEKRVIENLKIWKARFDQNRFFHKSSGQAGQF